MTQDEKLIERVKAAMAAASMERTGGVLPDRFLEILAPVAVAECFRWRPIEEAPMDGTQILAISIPAGTDIMLVRWIAPCEFLTEAELENAALDGVTDAELEKEGWYYADFMQGGPVDPDCYPTHFRLIGPGLEEGK
jgi:hypothetical protein